MGIGASEHLAFVRAKARFAGQKAQEHSFVRRNAVFTGHIAMHRWRHFLAESAARALPSPTSQRPTCPFSFAPGGTPPARPSAAPVAARCEPVPAFPLPPEPSTCLAWSSAAPVAARCELFPENRLTPASRAGSWPGAMAAGAREQTASCDAFVLSRRPPAPGAPLISLRKLGDSKLLITILVRRPVHGTSAGAWNIAVRTRGVFTHRDDFSEPACVKRGLVRTGTTPIISESAVTWTFRVTTPATVGREESLSSSPQRPDL